MRIKIDFGRIFPGLLIFLIGVGLFALWLILVFISFFLFFIPALHGIFFFTLDVLVASLVMMGIGALIILSGVSGWWWHQNTPGMTGIPDNREEGASWFDRVVSRRMSRDRMRPAERGGEIFGLFISLLVILFFFENQVQGTGFFTPAFRVPEQLLFYGTWLFGAFVSVTRITYGRRNAIRPLEILQALFLAFSAFWLLSVFPFNFAHLTDLLPHAIRFMFFWVNDVIGALVLLLTGLASTANVVYTSVLYAAVRSELVRRGRSPYEVR